MALSKSKSKERMNPIRKLEGVAAVILYVEDTHPRLQPQLLRFFVMVYDTTIAPQWNKIVLEDTVPEPAKLFFEIAAYLLFIILRNDSDLDRTEWQVTCSALIVIIPILTIRKCIGFKICLLTYHYSFVYLFVTVSLLPLPISNPLHYFTGLYRPAIQDILHRPFSSGTVKLLSNSRNLSRPL